MIPHPLLPQHYDRPEQKPVFVKQLFDAGARYYDSVCGWGFLGTGHWYRKWAQRRHGLKPGLKLLDVACGTGLMAAAAADILGSAKEITCVDPSDGMLEEAKKKLPATFVRSGAESMPLPDAQYDFLTLGYALRHFQDLEGTFQEFRRVLKPGGKVLILEITKPKHALGRWFFRTYFKVVYPALARLFTGSRDASKMMLYFWETMDACVPPKAVIASLQSAGFIAVKRTRTASLFSEYTAIRPSQP